MEQNKKRILFFGGMLFIGSVFIIIYLATTGNKAQIYTDIVVEYTSMYSSNKTNENYLIYILLFGGVAAYFIYELKIQKTYAVCVRPLEEDATCEDSKRLVYLLMAMFGIYYFVSAKVNPILLASVLVIFILFLVDKSLIMSGFVCFYVCVYAIAGLYRIYVLLGGESEINSMTISFVSLLLFMGLMISQNRQDALRKGCLAGQLAIPFVLLLYVASKYLYNGEMVTICVPRRVEVWIAVLMAAFLIEDGWVLRKHWKAKADISNLITFGTCVCIMAFNRFSGDGAIITTDVHHPYENVIGFSQIFQLGQKPFSEYIPVSGMYSVVQGAVFELFGQGQMGNYDITQNIFYLLAILLLIGLLRVQLSGCWVFLISLIFRISDYSRPVFILPIMLFLMLPKLIAKKNMWLQAWFLTSLFHGLYYPVFGAAVCISFLPLGVWQVVTYTKSGQLKENIKKVKFWAGWLFCMLVFLFFLPYLVGTYQHISAMAKQTVYADGIATFGQIVPEWFFPYLEHYQFVRIAAFYICSFLIPACLVWIAFALILKVGGIHIFGKKVSLMHVDKAAVVCSLAIMPAVSYTAVLVRAVPGTICIRSAGVFWAGIVLLFVIQERYLQGKKIRYALTIATVWMVLLVDTVGFFSMDEKLSAYHTVPENYVLIQNDEVEKLGSGFMLQQAYEEIKSLHTSFAQKDIKRTYFAEPVWFGFFYLCDVKGIGVMEALPTVKGYDAAQEAIEVAKENQAAIGGKIQPFYNYYLYHWLLTSGEYLWSEEEQCFLPNEDKLRPDQIKEHHKDLRLFSEGLDIGKNASSFGLSMDSLMEIFRKKDIAVENRQNGQGLEIELAHAIDGDEADYIYLEFEGMDQTYSYTLFDLDSEDAREGGMLSKYLMKKNYNPGMQVAVSWSDEQGEKHAIVCAMGEGKLLIPLGAGLNWLLNEHTYLHLSALLNGQEIDLPNLKDIQFLKLREAG